MLFVIRKTDVQKILILKKNKNSEKAVMMIQSELCGGLLNE